MKFYEKSVVCPFCGHDYVHERGFDVRQGGDYPNKSPFRQGHFAIKFYCEENEKEHRWTYTFGFHKGQCYFEIEKEEEDKWNHPGAGKVSLF